MQNKNNFLFILFYLCFISTCFSNESKDIKERADSLFSVKEYTKAKELYNELYIKKNIESDDLLLKLALINEGLGDYPKAIYYLKKYSITNPDLEVAIHVEELAENNQLMGYEVTDYEKGLIYLMKNKLNIVFSLFLLSIVFFILIVYLKFVKKTKFTGVLIAFGLFVGLSLSSIYLIKVPQIAVIKKECLLMSEPSAGSVLQKKIEKGHQVIIVDEVDIWVKIEMGDKFYFIRKSNLMII